MSVIIHRAFLFSSRRIGVASAYLCKSGPRLCYTYLNWLGERSSLSRLMLTTFPPYLNSARPACLRSAASSLLSERPQRETPSPLCLTSNLLVSFLPLSHAYTLFLNPLFPVPSPFSRSLSMIPSIFPFLRLPSSFRIPKQFMGFLSFSSSSTSYIYYACPIHLLLSLSSTSYSFSSSSFPSQIK